MIIQILISGTLPFQANYFSQGFTQIIIPSAQPTTLLVRHTTKSLEIHKNPYSPNIPVQIFLLFNNQTRKENRSLLQI